MFKIRTTKTKSGKTAVQVVKRRFGETLVIKHLGSGKNYKELLHLKTLARSFIRAKNKEMGQLSLFERIPKVPRVGLDRIIGSLEVTAHYHHFAYDFLSHFYTLNGFDTLSCPLLKDLSLIRIIEPCSKLRSLTLLAKYFGIRYRENFLYKNISKLKGFWPLAQEQAINYARSSLSSDFSLVFYDMTTLYFETFNEDADEEKTQVKGLRKCGFSKDGKSNQPQILAALVVSAEGYPIAFQVFSGNTFEGRTIIPVVLELKKSLKIERLTIVADAAMLSLENTEGLIKNGLDYIVGARLSNISEAVIKEMSQTLNKTEGKYFRIKTPRGYLICDFSGKRAAKDKSDREKQIRRARNQMDNPGKYLKRSRFILEKTRSKLVLNDVLIQKDELLDGIKGYYTNLEDVDESLVVSRYHDLWKIERAFRIAKSDLLARPIYHFKRENIEAHLLIVFLSLCVVKSIELKTKQSIKRVRDQIWDVLDIELTDTLTGKTFIKRTKIPELTY